MAGNSPIFFVTRPPANTLHSEPVLGHTELPAEEATEYSAQIKSKSGFASEFDPQLTQKWSKSKIVMGL
jgi:hypothetical protein